MCEEMSRLLHGDCFEVKYRFNLCLKVETTILELLDCFQGGYLNLREQLR